jgi:two-component system KDP operon response regulator KdpE
MKSGAKILVIDDELSIRNFLEVSLLANGFQVFCAATGKSGLLVAINERPDLIILDLGLPDRDGLSILKDLRSWYQSPILILTVKNADTDKAQLLDAGADDYLTKPFSVTELLARMRAVLRRSVNQSEQATFDNASLHINFLARTAKLKNEPLKLTTTEFDLLKVLVKNAGKLVTQRQLLREIWGPTAVEHSHYLRIYIAQLRKKLSKAKDLANMIETESGVGYRLNLLP